MKDETGDACNGLRPVEASWIKAGRETPARERWLSCRGHTPATIWSVSPAAPQPVAMF